jgi:hypothetical protein
MTDKQSREWDAQQLLKVLLSSGPVPREQLRAVAMSGSLQVQAEVLNVLTDSTGIDRIIPPLKPNDYQSIALKYLSRCIAANPDVSADDPDEIVHSRWGATYEMANWFVWLWKKYPTDRSAVTKVKDVIKELYLRGDRDTREALIQGTLEHLFENPDVVQLFSDWSSAEAELRAAYEQAIKWTQGGGHSPLWAKDLC